MSRYWKLTPAFRCCCKVSTQLELAAQEKRAKEAFSNSDRLSARDNHAKMPCATRTHQEASLRQVKITRHCEAISAGSAIPRRSL